MQSHLSDTEVVIVGAGPAGLTAAIALARAGVDTLVLERRHAPVPCGAGDRRSARRPWSCALVGPRGRATRGRSGSSSGPGSPRRSPRQRRATPRTRASRPASRARSSARRPPPLFRRTIWSPSSSGTFAPSRPRASSGAGGDRDPARGDGVVLTAREVEGRNERRIRARYLIGRTACEHRPEGARNPRGSPRELGGSLAVTFRAPLWELLGEHRYVIYWLTGERSPVFVPVGQRSLGVRHVLGPRPRGG